MTLHPGEPQDQLRGSWVLRQTRPTLLLAPGDQIGSLRVVAAPGHTPDLVAFFDERDGTLIAGDAFHTQAGTAVAGTMRWLFPFPAMATWHQPTAIRSAIALYQMNPTRLAVGHGAVLENPLAQMETAIQEAEAKLGSVEQTSHAS
jgi:glyoxylase-like metal-dependent hydrolase (beta-lactamase superfamily II)